MYAKAIEHLPSTEGIVKQAIQEVWQKINLTIEQKQAHRPLSVKINA